MDLKEKLLEADSESLQRKTGEFVQISDDELAYHKNFQKAQISNTLLRITKATFWVLFILAVFLALWGVGYFLCLTVKHLNNVLICPQKVSDLLSSFVQAFLTIFATLFFSDKFLKK